MVVSNSEPNPAETVAAAPSPDRRGPEELQLLEPRDVPLGGLRAMKVRRTLPQRARSLIGAWCFLDHYGPDNVSETGGMNVPAHPHTGLQTASWLFSGEIEHRDSAGFHAFVRPGELNLMTAGHGISHSERSTPSTTVLHGAQFWIALPQSASHTPKTFVNYVPPPLRGPDWSAHVFLGSLLGETSPVPTHTPLVGAELRMNPGVRLTFSIDPTFEHGVLVDTGSVTMTRGGAGSARGGSPALELDQEQLGFAPLGADVLQLIAGENGARLLFLGGEPLGEQIVMWWNFIGRSHEDISAARADWQAQIAKVGVTDPDLEAPRHAESAIADRFGLPNDEPDPPLPAPPLPIARLLPRRQ